MNTARRLASARNMAMKDPVKVLQSYYKFLEVDKKKKKKEEYLKKYYDTVKVLDWQVAEAKAAKKKQEEADMAAIQAEFARSEKQAREQKEREERKRQARILEFKEREVERNKALAEKRRRREAEQQREKDELEVIIRERKAAQIAAKRKAAAARAELKAQLDKEVQRIKANRSAAKAEMNREVDPEELQRARQKLIQRAEMEEQRKLKYVAQNMRRQEAAAAATLKMAAPQREKLRRLSELENKWTQEQIQYWRNDLKQREVRKKQLEDERLAIVIKQREERRAALKKAAEEEAAYVKRITSGADTAAIANKRVQDRQRMNAARHRADLEEQIRKRRALEPKTAVDKLPEMSRRDLDEVLSNPNMLLRIKSSLEGQPVTASGFLPSSGD